jgi:hypothetical protein
MSKTISIDLGSGEQGQQRYVALQEMARERGQMWNDQPSIGRLVKDIADEYIERSEMVTFILQTVSGAFGPTDEVPWHRAHEEIFYTLRDARQQLEADKQEMRDRCGTGWDSHRRIIAGADTVAEYTLHCMGVIGAAPWESYCPEHKMQDVTVEWPAGYTAPEPDVPEGWASLVQCSECRAREAEFEARWMERMEREAASHS